jgi:hypothetical protein
MLKVGALFFVGKIMNHYYIFFLRLGSLICLARELVRIIISSLAYIEKLNKNQKNCKGKGLPKW